MGNTKKNLANKKTNNKSKKSTKQHSTETIRYKKRKQRGGNTRPCEKPNAVRKCSSDGLSEFEGAPVFPPPFLSNPDDCTIL